MSCNCKTKSVSKEAPVKDENHNGPKLSVALKNVAYFMVGLIVVSAAFPFIFLFVVYSMFKSIVLNQATNLMPSFKYLIDNFNKKPEIEDDTVDFDDEEFDSDDYEMVGVDEVKRKEYV